MTLAVTIPAGEDGKLLAEAVRLTESGGQGQLPTHALQHIPTAANTARPSLVLPLDTPVGQPGWDKSVGERIQWMVGQNIQQAEIKLTPPNLGPLEIKISLHNDQASVSFVAAQAPTRDALEASIPRLREMLGEINLNLANVDVGHQEAGESSGERSAESVTDCADESATVEWPADDGGTGVINRNGLLDTYA
ncbi:MAG: flagellar hook-length control protein FliK [Candidatus Thiodiazotropha sp. (ex Epidulcina cf. delphinae)]|nr:flagellar hook-length control protein FliK [Candidatus Thiodiazotropha sp. (ex Epidulcina cf. delphinae)]